MPRVTHVVTKHIITKRKLLKSRNDKEWIKDVEFITQETVFLPLEGFPEPSQSLQHLRNP